MRTDVEARAHHTPILRKAAAGIVLVLAGVLAISLVIAFIKTIAVTVLVVVAVVAVLWALKTLLW